MELISNPNEVDELMLIDDPRIPEEIREHAARFETPVTYAAWGGTDWVLFAEDGEVIDICG